MTLTAGPIFIKPNGTFSLKGAVCLTCMAVGFSQYDARVAIYLGNFYLLDLLTVEIWQEMWGERFAAGLMSCLTLHSS